MVRAVGGGDALPDGEDEVDGDGDAGDHVLEYQRLMVELLHLHKSEPPTTRRRRAAACALCSSSDAEAQS